MLMNVLHANNNAVGIQSESKSSKWENFEFSDNFWSGKLWYLIFHDDSLQILAASSVA